MKKSIVSVLTAGLATLSSFAVEQPNIVFIFADDMGYGEVQSLNPERGLIPTPHLDELVSEGMVFTDAHTSSSVCTPSRYSLMTGRYNWRTTRQAGVLNGYSEALIDEDRLTVGELLQENGYDTAMIGKWHLGMTLPVTSGALPTQRKPKQTNLDWEGEIQHGPADRGFDYFFGISGSLDMAPYIYLENRRFVGAADNTAPQADAPGFVRDQVLPELAKRSAEYIKGHKGDKPFFLYVPLTSPHSPVLPTKEWLGKSGLNRHADFQMQTDDEIGKIIQAVDDAGLTENTLIIVTADNGTSTQSARIPDLESMGHYSSANLRGSKADILEGGHRVPFIVRWPKVVEAGSTSDATICLTDFIATCADIAGADLADDEGVDSVSFLPALKSEPITTERQGIVHHAISGQFAIRSGDWKLILAPGSAGWTYPAGKTAIDLGLPLIQLYNLKQDIGETKNLQAEYPEKVGELLELLENYVAEGRSTAGPKQMNDAEIDLWKKHMHKKPGWEPKSKKRQRLN
ncbi:MULTISPECIES: arylsulfatase [unclassified Lentimonas]|uniref:sulfatase family protein n=1 Tax=unclassified Lentimonas TaxID=2630993 RepID=UPI00132C2875|nr:MULTISPECIES: arylsulfatase [unclassified Lentimonas]CAA6691734.1 Choline-sulfatase (EC [Lentimonas sp. CC19]CAA6696093.1 Choline-sulfatase (EC [Lentimonas sp. CC10]CAA7070085.1 Choline-sulfatase (EC [Lentimonas sp. CC11]